MSKYRETEIRNLAQSFKALSNPNRLKIFQQLLSCCTPGELCSTEEATKYCVGDLGNGLNIAASTLSHHIKELSRAGLIRMERRGQHVDCWVEPEVMLKLNRFFQADS